MLFSVARVPRPLDSSYVLSVDFSGESTIVSGDCDGKMMVWSATTGEEQTEALPDYKFALTTARRGRRDQQVGRWACMADGDLLLIHPILEDGGAAGGADEANKANHADKTARAPVAFFRAPSTIISLDCKGAHISLGCQSGEILQLRAAVLLT